MISASNEIRNLCKTLPEGSLKSALESQSDRMTSKKSQERALYLYMSWLALVAINHNQSFTGDSLPQPVKDLATEFGLADFNDVNSFWSIHKPVFELLFSISWEEPEAEKEKSLDQMFEDLEGEDFQFDEEDISALSKFMLATEDDLEMAYSDFIKFGYNFGHWNQKTPFSGRFSSKRKNDDLRCNKPGQ